MAQVFPLLKYPPRAKQITKLIRQTFFSVITDLRLPNFLVIAQKINFLRKFSGNRVTNVSGNPRSSPIHIASHCAEARPNFPVIPWKLIPQKLFLVTMLPISGNSNEINFTNKKAAGNILEGGDCMDNSFRNSHGLFFP